MTIRESVAQYIQELANEDISDHSTDLFGNGFLTSLDVLDLIAFVEDTFELEISGDDVDMESFGSIDGIVGLVKRIRECHASGS